MMEFKRAWQRLVSGLYALRVTLVSSTGVAQGWVGDAPRVSPETSELVQFTNIKTVLGERAITGITAANPAVVTSVAHGYADGDVIYIDDVVGMTEVNGFRYTLAGVTTDTYQLSGVDSSAYTAYTSGGVTAQRKTLTIDKVHQIKSAQIMAISNNAAAADDHIGTVVVNELPITVDTLLGIGSIVDTGDFGDYPVTFLPIGKMVDSIDLTGSDDDYITSIDLGTAKGASAATIDLNFWIILRK